MLMQFFIFFANINCIFLKSAWTKGYFYLMVSKLVLTLFTDYKVVFCCHSDCTVCIMSIFPSPPPPHKKRKNYTKVAETCVNLLFVLSAQTSMIAIKIAHKKHALFKRHWHCKDYHITFNVVNKIIACFEVLITKKNNF